MPSLTMISHSFPKHCLVYGSYFLSRGAIDVIVKYDLVFCFLDISLYMARISLPVTGR